MIGQLPTFTSVSYAASQALPGHGHRLLQGRLVEVVPAHDACAGIGPIEGHPLVGRLLDTMNWTSRACPIRLVHMRVPAARYEDVTGLCKLAMRTEIEEQDWSLNPGRYVGVVIEEDGKTEEEFLSGLIEATDEWAQACEQARELEEVLNQNLKLIAGVE